MAILCCLCGTTIEPNGVNMCIQCLSTQVDITEGIQKECEITQCKKCLRFNKGSSWVDCGLESQELMGICLKSINGLTKVKLIDATFIWTEPHSKRIKVKITIRKETLRDTMLQQSFIVTFIVHTMKCPDCSKQYHNNTWKSKVQVRQKVDHKRTFFHLEQLLLKHQAHQKAVGITPVKDGMDFYFTEKNEAESFLHFLSSHVPQKTKTSTKLISTDNHNNTANLKITSVVEIVPICKEDLVILPKKLASRFPSTHNLFLIARITSQIHLVDPLNCNSYELSADKYWKFPFHSLQDNSNLIDFIVLDVEPVNSTHDTSQQKGRYLLVDVEVVRESDFGINDKSFIVRTHLGSVLKSGDTVKGYDLSTSNLNDGLLLNLRKELPDIILVRRVNQKKPKKKKMKSLGMRNTDGLKKSEANKIERDYEQFLEEYESKETELTKEHDLSKDLEKKLQIENDNEVITCISSLNK